MDGVSIKNNGTTTCAIYGNLKAFVMAYIETFKNYSKPLNGLEIARLLILAKNINNYELINSYIEKYKKKRRVHDTYIKFDYDIFRASPEPLVTTEYIWKTNTANTNYTGNRNE